jgi:hypothetical protein
MLFQLPLSDLITALQAAVNAIALAVQHLKQSDYSPQFLLKGTLVASCKLSSVPAAEIECTASLNLRFSPISNTA